MEAKPWRLLLRPRLRPLLRLPIRLRRLGRLLSTPLTLRLYLRLRPSPISVGGLRSLGGKKAVIGLQLKLRFRPLPILVEGLRNLGVTLARELQTASSSPRVSSSTGTMGPVLRRATATCIGLASTQLPALPAHGLHASIWMLAVSRSGSKLEAPGPIAPFRELWRVPSVLRKSFWESRVAWRRQK